MLNVIIAMAVAIVILALLWRRSAGLHADAVSDYLALQGAAQASIDSANETREVLEEQEREIRSLQKAHSVIKKSLKEASEEVDRSSGSPAKIVGLWNKTFSGEK